MRKRIMLFGLTLLFIFLDISCQEVWAKEELTALNPVIDVGNKIYTQHDEDNNDIYDLQKSGTGITVVYERILVEFTADKAWTTSGEFIDNVSTSPHGATSPENYIPVKAGEQYFIKTYGVAITETIWYTPVLFLDNNDEVVSCSLVGEFSKSKSGVTITIPENAVKMHLTMFNHQNFTLQKVLELTDAEFDNLPINREKIETEIEQKYEQYQKDKIVYKKPNKAYITFVNDDTGATLDEYAELFLSKDVPLVLATIPELLIENASSQKETRLETARRVEEVGGEIIAHNGGVLTEEDFSDYNTMYSFFVRTKQLFNYYNFDVNGIILAGGAGQVLGAQETEKWASSLYSYSDLYGVEYDKKEIALDSVYYHARKGLVNYGSDFSKIKQEIDNAITNQSWLVFYFHNSNEIDMAVLEQVLDYVNAKSETELEVVTYKEMYQKNAAKESEIINTKTTYYVSSTGTSAIGTDEDDPMSYERAKKKAYRSGETIRFKKGDTFYGTFDPTIIKVDDAITTISSYGEGEMPNIVGYKTVNSRESWQLHEDGIYKIDLTDTTSFSGLMTTDDNSTNIGFLEDSQGIKYFNKKSALNELENEYDFYCDSGYLYIKSAENPYDKLGELKLATKTNLFILHSNLKIENIRFSGTGAHGLVGSDESIENVEISNNIIEDIGGSHLNGTTRYGNGIEFYSTDASNITVKDNIIRNVYDVGFTMQGTKGSGNNVVVKDNVFVSNSQDSEIWENGSATGIRSYKFTHNISINAGRGWGHEARPDKYVAAHILFWGYLIENTDIYFYDNVVYNPRRLYFIEQTNGTNIFFKETDYIRSDYNTYQLAEDATIFRDSYQISEKDDFISEYNKDVNSVFSLIEADENIIKAATTSDNIQEIKKLFGWEEEPTTQPTDEPSPTGELQPTNESGVAASQQPTVAPTSISTDQVPAKGTKLTDLKTKAVYTVTKAGKKVGTVTYTRPIRKNVTSISVSKTVTISGITYKVTAIAPNAFKNCKKLTNVTVGSNVAIIGKAVFSGCSKLKTVTIGRNVRTIGAKAFYKCKNLKQITIKTTKLTSKNVGNKAFKGIYSKAVIKVPKSKLAAYKQLLKAKGVGSQAKIRK